MLAARFQIGRSYLSIPFRHPVQWEAGRTIDDSRLWGFGVWIEDAP